MRKDRHACELFTFGLRVCVCLLGRPRGPRGGLARWLRGPPGLPAEHGSAARIPRLFRAWRTCWDLPGGAASRALPGRGAGRTRRRPGCSPESMAERGQLPGYPTQPSWVSVGTREAVIVEVFLLSFCFVGLARRAFSRKQFPTCFLFKNCLRSCLTN